MPNGKFFYFNEDSRESVISGIAKQCEVRELQDVEDVISTQEKFNCWLPTYVYAQYLELCYTLHEDIIT